jgi:beta-lactamase superfamily II metal-dependent hydrolase
VTPGALLANLVASPLLAFAFVAAGTIPAVDLLGRALTAAGVSFAPGFSPHVLLARCAAKAIDAALVASRLVCAIPGMSYVCVTPARWLMLSSLLAAALAGAGHAPRAVRRGALVAAVSLALLCLIPGERAGPLETTVRESAAPAGVLRLTVLDVGQGSAALIESPGGRRLLVDGGGFAASSFDVGERVVARALLTLGVRNLSAVAMTHEDFDHVGGLPAILDLFPGEEIWAPAASRANPAVARIARIGVKNGRSLRYLARGMRFDFGGAAIEVYHPPRSPGAARDNDLSLVLRVACGGRSFLLPGDIEREAEMEIAALLPPSDLLLVPHHGSRTSSSLRFLESVRPSIAVISCGYMNRFRHPHGEALARLASAGSSIARTDLEGAQRVTIIPREDGGSSLIFERWDGGAWAARPVAAGRVSGPAGAGSE